MYVYTKLYESYTINIPMYKIQPQTLQPIPLRSLFTIGLGDWDWDDKMKMNRTCHGAIQRRHLVSIMLFSNNTSRDVGCERRRKGMMNGKGQLGGFASSASFTIEKWDIFSFTPVSFYIWIVGYTQLMRELFLCIWRQRSIVTQMNCFYANVSSS